MSIELRGKLLVDEFVVVKPVKLRSTLCGRALIFCKVDALLDGFGGLSESLGSGNLAGLGTSRVGTAIEDLRGLSFASTFTLTVFFGVLPASMTCSDALRGDGDLEVDIHDFRAKVAND